MGFCRSSRCFLFIILLAVPCTSSPFFRLPPGLQSRLQYSLSVPRPRLSQYLYAFWSSPATQYRRLLEEQRDLLERQLRQTRQELALIRKHYQDLQKKKSAPLTSEQVKLYHTRITALEKEIQSAANLRTKLEKAIEMEQRKVTALQEKIKKLEQKKSGNKAGQQSQLDALRAEMETIATEQLLDLRATMEQRMQEALDNARIAAEQEKLLAVQETTNRLTMEFQRQLEDQTAKADQAVERERVKMRKLIKALAEREKNLLEQSEAQLRTRRVSSSKSTPQRDIGSSSQPVRGPLNK